MKYVRLLLIAAMLSLASFTGVAQTALPQVGPAISQQDTKGVVELGDGYQMFKRDGYVAIHFPRGTELTSDPASTEPFFKALTTGLLKAFGTKAFGKDGPVLEHGVLIAGDRAYSVEPLYETEEGDTIVGVFLAPLPRA